MPDGNTVLTDPPAPAPAPAAEPAPVPAAEPAPAPAPASEAKPAQPERVVPEKYDLKLPDGAEFVKDTDLAAIAEEAKAFKLTNEEAQRLVESRVKERKSFVDAQVAEHETRVKAWAEDLRKDPEIAGKDGAVYGANIAGAKLVINKFASPALRELLNKSGYGNHPELVRMMVNISKAMKEDSFHTGEDLGKTGGKVITENQLAAKLYPTNSK